MRTIASSSALAIPSGSIVYFHPRGGKAFSVKVEPEPRTGEELLFAGCCFCDPAELRQNFFFAKDQIFLVIHRDVIAGVFSEQNPVARLDVQWHAAPFFNLSCPDGDHFTFLRLLFRRVGY